MHIWHVWLLNCRSRIDKHRHLVEYIVCPQWLQILNSPDLGPRDNILYVTDCIKGEVYVVSRAILRNCSGWKEIVNIRGNVRVSGSNGSSSRTASGSSSGFLSHSFHPWSYGRLKHLDGDCLIQGATSCSTWAALHSNIGHDNVKSGTSLLVDRGGKGREVVGWGDWISNMPLSQLLQNKLQRHMHARAHTHAHLSSTAHARSQRVKKAWVSAGRYQSSQTRWMNKFSQIPLYTFTHRVKRWVWKKMCPLLVASVFKFIYLA